MDLSLAFLVALALSGASQLNAGPVKKSNEPHDIFGLEFSNNGAVRSAIFDELLYVFCEFDRLVNGSVALDIFLEYFYNDEEFGNTYIYVHTVEFKDLFERAIRIEDVRHFCEYLEIAGLDACTMLHDLLTAPLVKPVKHDRTVKITGGGVSGYISDIKAILPIKKIKSLFEEKLETSPVFVRFVDYFRASRFQELLDSLRFNKEFQMIINIAKANGVDIIAIMDFLATRYGFQFPNIIRF